MSRVVIDIETLGFPFESFDAEQQKYILKFSQSEEECTEAIQKLSLYPTTAQIIAIGLYNPDTARGKVFFQSDTPTDHQSPDGTAHYCSCDEQSMLVRFWEDVAHFDQFITFNGRGFDCPFLMLRSAILQIRPSRNLMPYRYEKTVHIDLLEQLTFYGAFRKFSLDFYCKSFGIESPKSHGITGLDMGMLSEQKRFLEIAEYCFGDLVATAALFRRWEQFLKI